MVCTALLLMCIISKEVKGKTAPALDNDNLMSLCMSCHSRVHAIK